MGTDVLFCLASVWMGTYSVEPLRRPRAYNLAGVTLTSCLQLFVVGILEVSEKVVPPRKLKAIMFDIF